MQYTDLEKLNEFAANSRQLIDRILYIRNLSVPGYYKVQEQNSFFKSDSVYAHFQEFPFSEELGNSFIDFYGPEAFSSISGFLTISDEISNPVVLGSAIYSQWKYWNRRSCENIPTSELEWLYAAFSRLEQITSVGTD